MALTPPQMFLKELKFKTEELKRLISENHTKLMEEMGKPDGEIELYLGREFEWKLRLSLLFDALYLEYQLLHGTDTFPDLPEKEQHAI